MPHWKKRCEVSVSYYNWRPNIQILLLQSVREKTTNLVFCFDCCMNERNPPPTNEHFGNTANTKTDHSQNSISMYFLIDSHSASYMPSDLCTTHTIGQISLVPLLASFINCGNCEEDVRFHLSAKEINIECLVSDLKGFVAKWSCNFRTEFEGQMFFSLLLALWMTYGVAGK